VTPNPSLEQGPPPAWHLAREALAVIIRFAGQAPSRFRPLSSNVSQHTRHPRCSPSPLRRQSPPKTKRSKFAGSWSLGTEGAALSQLLGKRA
jgi:hypothetical protein